ncbi:MAG: hypothetical protein ACTSYI_14850 [Promethearchaeota archaeon]
MNELLMLNLPGLLLILFTLVIFPFISKPKVTRTLTNIALLFAILLQTFYIFFSTNLQFLAFFALPEYLNLGALLIGDAVLILFFVLHLFSREEIKLSHSSYFYSVIYLVTTFSSYILAQSTNVLIISFVYVVLSNCLYYLFFFGQYKKHPNLAKGISEINLFVAFILLILNIAIAFIFNSFDLSTPNLLLNSATTLQELSLYVGFLVAFSLLPGLGPLFYYHGTKFYRNASPHVIQAFSIIITPLSGLVLLRLLSNFIGNNRILGFCLFSVGLLGISIGIAMQFKIHKDKSKNTRAKISEFIGIFSNLDFHVNLLLLSILYLTSNNKSEFYLLGASFFLLSVILNLVLNSLMAPLLHIFDADNYLASIILKPKFVEYCILGLLPFIFILPVFPGNLFIGALYQMTIYRNPDFLFDSILLWIGLFTVIAVVAWRLFGIAFLFRKYYKNKTNYPTDIPSVVEKLVTRSRFHAAIIVLYVLFGFLYLVEFSWGISRLAQNFFQI